MADSVPSRVLKLVGHASPSLLLKHEPGSLSRQEGKEGLALLGMKRRQKAFEKRFQVS